MMSNKDNKDTIVYSGTGKELKDLMRRSAFLMLLHEIIRFTNPSKRTDSDFIVKAIQTKLEEFELPPLYSTEFDVLCDAIEQLNDVMTRVKNR